MKTLARRAARVYRDEGALAVTAKSIRYSVRAFVHFLGKRWLYGIDSYRSFSRWLNARRGRYDALADPLAIYWIDPLEIAFVTGRGPNPGQFQWQQLGTVRGGDWDRSTERFDQLGRVQAIVDHYENGVPWDRTPLDHDGASAETVQKRIDRTKKLYESISQDGYRTMDELVDKGIVDPENRRLPEVLTRRNEVAVDVGRDGEFLFVDGRHRLAIAKILELEEIPVRISARHVEWQRIRERVAEADSVDDLPESVSQHLDHPDLQDVVSDGHEK